MSGCTEELRKIADRIKTLRDEHSKLLRIGAGYAKEVGELLLRAKPYLGRQWGKWLAMEFDITTECAFRYTTIAKNWELIEAHQLFPNMGVHEMFDVARSRPIRKKSYKLIGVRLDKLLAIIDERVSEKVSEFPELADLLEAIDKARPYLEDAGLLKSDTESRKRAMQKRVHERHAAICR